MYYGGLGAEPPAKKWDIKQVKIKKFCIKWHKEWVSGNVVKNSFHSQSFGKGITNYNQSDFAHKGPKRITPPYKDWDAIKKCIDNSKSFGGGLL